MIRMLNVHRRKFLLVGWKCKVRKKQNVNSELTVEKNAYSSVVTRNRYEYQFKLSESKNACSLKQSIVAVQESERKFKW